MVTLAGVLVGAGATFVATTSIERAKWRRAIDTRWDEERLAAYVEYANAVKTILEIVFRLAAQRGLPNLTTPADEPLAANALADAEAHRTVKWEQVLLLGSPDTIVAARQWHMAVYDFSFLAMEESPEQEEFLRQFRVLGTGWRRRADCSSGSGCCRPIDYGEMHSDQQVLCWSVHR
jgi:hypothetical protein